MAVAWHAKDASNLKDLAVLAAVADEIGPAHAILSIHHNLPGPKVGDPTTELGLARISDPEYPQVIANYASLFADGRFARGHSNLVYAANGLA